MLPGSTSGSIRLCCARGFRAYRWRADRSAVAVVWSRRPPLFGFFRRRVKEGRVGTLATSFEAVCDVWRATVPGCLCATLSRDPADDAFVHDLRIFANKASYAAHVED